MKTAITILALNVFSTFCAAASVFLILCDKWQWWLFLAAAVSFVHGISKEKVEEK